jgi:hypothetical protein
MPLYVYSPGVRAKAIGNYEGTVKATARAGSMSTPQFEHELEVALAEAIDAPMRHNAESSGKGPFFLVTD